MLYIKQLTAITFLFIGVYCLNSCTNFEANTKGYQEYKRRLLQKRKEIEDFMEQDTSSPFSVTHAFQGLNYYDIDTTYKVKAKMIRLDNQEIILMKTSINEEKRYRKWSQITFMLQKKQHTLFAYQSIDFEDNDPFIPFTDASNGMTTYEMGRYLDLNQLTDNKGRITLDFNLAYNPYCAYVDEYNCIIPPRENHIPIKIEAGEQQLTKKDKPLVTKDE